MKGLDTTKLYHYKVSVEYKEGYFNNPNHPRKQELNFYSILQRDKNYIQNAYKHAEVLNVELVSVPRV